MVRVNSYLYTRNIAKVDQEQSKISLATHPYLSYIRGVDYKGLNKAIIVTFVTYHMA
jgi:hypothetical protein